MTRPFRRKTFFSVANPHYMLDTNAVSDLIRRPQGRVAHRAITVKPGELCISIVVAAELEYGAARSGSARLRRQLDAVLTAIETLPLDKPADRHYGMIRSELELTGHAIGGNDLLIAAHARSLGATLVTNNMDEFRRVPSLDVEDWR